MKPVQITPDIFAIHEFLSDQECDHLLSHSEKTGYEPATVETEKGAKLINDVRNNQRVLYRSERLATTLWEKAAGLIPGKIGHSVAIGLNELFRFYKYEPGQQFARHTDESYIRNETEASYYTFMIYLNGDYEDGETIFDSAIIKGEKGMALCFLHSLPHAGAVVTRGTKYVLRTDIMYRLTEENN